MRQIPLTPVLLDSLVTRVEEGDALTQEELDVIGREVQRRPDSLDWRLCYAHALINSDMPHRALELLKFEGADSMHEILLHIVRARAYGALERYAEAEAELKKILRIYPGHADALRALAIMRLKSGAPADAAALCESVLITDPLDDATRQILAEARYAMEAADKAALPEDAPEKSESQTEPASTEGGSALPKSSARVEAVSKSFFFRKLDDALSKAGWKHRILREEEQLVVQLPRRGPVKLSITDFWQESRGSAEKRAEAVEKLMAELRRIDEETPLA